MKRILISLLTLMSVSAHAAPDRTVAYFDDMANPVEIKIVPAAQPSQPLTVYVEPQKFAAVRIPGGKIAKLTINEKENGSTVETETLYAGEDPRSYLERARSVLGKVSYGHDATINNDERYVIMHNRINLARTFRLLNPSDLEARKTAKETAQAGGAILGGGLEATGKAALWLLTAGAIAP